MENQKPQKRVLVLADFGCITGFATVAHNVIAQILKEKDIDYFIDVVGINYYGLPTGLTHNWLSIFPRVRLLPATVISQGDLFGRNGFLNLLSSGSYDIAWILQDTFNIEPVAEKILEIRTELVKNGKKPFKYIFYFPIDARPMENWVTKSVSKADIPVVYTKYGYDQCVTYDETLKDRLQIVPHGIDANIFKPLDKETVEKFRKHYFAGMADNKFLITNVNRNQPRKDIARTMQIFSLFKRQVPEALLYLHMKKNDVAYDLDEVARQFELIPDKDYITPYQFDEHDGIEEGILNHIYNASDVVMTTSLGEGWGLSMTEAMAAKTPVIAPNHTSLSELLADGRGTLVAAGKTQSEWFIMGNDNCRLRPLANIAEYVDKLAWIRNNYKQAQNMAEKAHQFVTTTWTWDIVGEKWREIFKQAQIAEKVIKIGRNDPCTCGSTKKWKNCHGK